MSIINSSILESDPNKLTPMMQQYMQIKASCPDCLLFFRMGDFYELFFQDAITASKVLDIALTKRGKHENADIAMCGVPFHSADSYLEKLIKAGHKVAICEQKETPQEAKKRGHKAIVNREIVRILTAGTVTEDSLLEAQNPNYLASLTKSGNFFSLAWLDISTGEFFYSSFDKSQIPSELAKISPKEILINDKFLEDEHLREILNEHKHILTTQVGSFFETNRCENHLKNHYEIALTQGIAEFNHSEISACGSIIEYVNLTQKCKLPNLKLPKQIKSEQFMTIDFATSRNLEIFISSAGSHKGSLLHAINRTITAAGGRSLRQFLSNPLLDIQKISSRTNLVEFFLNHEQLSSKIRHLFSEVSDIERITSRLLMNRGGPRDLLSLKNSFFALKHIYEIIYFSKIELPEDLQHILKKFSGLDQLENSLNETISDEAPLLARDGGFIKKGFSARIDELRLLKENSNVKIMELRNKYKELTGITTLKIQHNNILGYFVDVTPQNSSKMPQEHFFHRQTLANSVRYSTSELQKLESEINNCHEIIIETEIEIFNSLLEEISANSAKIFALAFAAAMLDVIVSFSTLALEKNYVKPIITNDHSFEIKAGRHATVESSISESLTNASNFVPNDCLLENDQKLWLLTGPNMAGKSTFLRQNAIIAILAQIGCFVPASFAKIGIIDRVFSRVGAADDLARGRSTFMVEMVETAVILNQATEKSLIILDEIGRGTATFDGLSIAWSCLEFIHSSLKCRAIFATHYHELTNLQNQLRHLKCHSMKVKEWDGKVIFMHEVTSGAADKSYGIHVAKLAGLPQKVIKRAEQLLEILENSQKGKINNQDLPLFARQEQKRVLSEAEKQLSQLNIDNLSPRQALEILYNLKQLL